LDAQRRSSRDGTDAFLTAANAPTDRSRTGILAVFVATVIALGAWRSSLKLDKH
jgi:hypothetical protein